MEDPLPPPRAPKESQRIAKLLARAGIASRREIERMIADGRVAIDGTPIETPATLLTSLAGVTVDGQPVKAAAPARLFLYHKPSGVLTAERDPAGRPTIYDRMPKGLPRLMPVGRLDLNTEGLLLLTTDGGLKRQLELPSSGVERVYRARAFGDVSQEQLENLIHGVEIEGVRYGAIDANLERRTGRNQWIEMKITEGKNREVRRVLEYLGLKVSRLIRVAYGPFVLGDLPAGQVEEIRQHDLVVFRKDLTGAKPDALRAAAVPRSVEHRPRPAPRPTPPAQGKAPPAKGPRKPAAPSRPQRSTNPEGERTPRPRQEGHGNATRSPMASSRPQRATKPGAERTPRPPREEAKEVPATEPKRFVRKPGWARPAPKRHGGPKRPGPRRGR